MCCVTGYNMILRFILIPMLKQKSHLLSLLNVFKPHNNVMKKAPPFPVRRQEAEVPRLHWSMYSFKERENFLFEPRASSKITDQEGTLQSEGVFICYLRFYDSKTHLGFIYTHITNKIFEW